MKKVTMCISTNCIRIILLFAVRFKLALIILYVTSVTVLLSLQHAVFPNSKGFSGHLKHSFLLFANGASHALSSKHMLAQVCGLV